MGVEKGKMDWQVSILTDGVMRCEGLPKGEGDVGYSVIFADLSWRWDR